MHSLGKSKLSKNLELVSHDLIIFGERSLNNWLKTSFYYHCVVQ